MSGDEDHGGSEEEFLLTRINIGGDGGRGTGGRDESCRLNFDGFWFSSEHKKKLPRGVATNDSNSILVDQKLIDGPNANEKGKMLIPLIATFQRGITRHKHHLVGDTAQVAKCSKVPSEVKAFFKETFDKKKKEKEARNIIPHFDDVVDLDEEVNDDELNTQKKRSPVSSSGSVTPRSKSNYSWIPETKSKGVLVFYGQWVLYGKASSQGVLLEA
uniref:Uncharacterized protein n=1 Tax=Lactuca sativa TaxID=4236 RepID=A0A9R1UIM2_LACSA|nr:hypothetical protein LSAT_V11C900463310 [Lactuca sativa]